MSSKLDGRSSASTDSDSANLSTSSTQQNLPPLAFDFTFYLPLNTPIASCFYSEDPVKRTKTKTIELDENEWGNSRTSTSDRRIDFDRADKFISRAIAEEEKGQSLTSDSEHTKTSLDGTKRKIQHDDSPGIDVHEPGSFKKKCRTEELNQLADDSESTSPAEFNLALPRTGRLFLSLEPSASHSPHSIRI